MRRPPTAPAPVTALVAGLLLAAAGAQDPAAPPPTPSSALLLRAGSPQASIDTVREVGYELSLRDFGVRTRFFDVVARRYADALRGFDKGRERLRQKARKLVPQVQRALQQDGGEAEIEELRRRALSLSRRQDLSKQLIADEIDPLLERLVALVLPTPDDVLRHDDSLADDLDELRDAHDTLQGWFDLYDDTRRGLAEDETVGRRHLAKHDTLPPPPPIESLDAELEGLCLMALPMSARDRRALEHNEELRATTAAEEFAGTLELNRIRLALGLNALLIDEKLGDAARDHSKDMLRLGFFSHTSPVEGKRTPGQRAALAGTSGGAENIAAGQETGRGAIRAWWYSPGHHKNMLGGHSRTGLGQAGALWTQMFGG